MPVSLSLQFVKDGVFKAELNRFLTNELAEDGYSGVQVRHTPARTEIIILATRTQNVLGGCCCCCLSLVLFYLILEVFVVSLYIHSFIYFFMELEIP